uniref:Sugar phosphate transporter domain-containing protein n=1 Tax=Amorphochlora amoebiformis TaxID=1561963 RepID=A0A7S0GXW9_9EUKA|mmetsp:Transcript_22110/g.34808  ORF Transcript_22110/g.34808 Transcript_22110/m.34808 type:complete len:382 (+) Transcript_22110:90-1235(+)
MKKMVMAIEGAKDSGSSGMASKYSSADIAMSTVGFMVVSAGMSVANKMAVNYLKLPMILLAIQSAFGILCLLPLYKWINIGTLTDIVRLSSLTLVYCGMLITSLFAFQALPLTTIVVIGSSAPLITLMFEIMCCVKTDLRASMSTICSIIFVVGGMGLYGFALGDFTFGGIGGLWISAKLLLAVFYQVGLRYLMVSSKSPININIQGIMLWNAIVLLIVSSLLAFALGEHEALVQNQVNLRHIHTIIAVLASCAGGTLIGYTGLRAQARISATSFMVCCTANKVVVIVFGIVMLNEPCTLQIIVAALLVIIGTTWYTFDRREMESLETWNRDSDKGLENSVTIAGWMHKRLSQSLTTDPENDSPHRKSDVERQGLLGNDED